MTEREELFKQAEALGLDVAKNIATEKLKAMIKDAGPVVEAEGQQSNAVADTLEASDAQAAEAEAQAAEASAPPAPTKLVVKGPAKGRRRAGRRFSLEATTLMLSDLNEGEIEALEGDPELITVRV